MKRLAVSILCGTVMLSSAACGNNGLKTESSSSEISESVSSVSEEEEEINEPLEISVSGDGFPETAAVDKEECSVILTGLEKNDAWGYTLRAELENRTSGSSLLFTIESASINGVSFDPDWAVDLDAGKKSISTISFADEALEAYDIGEITDLTMTFSIYDRDNWNTEDAVVQTVSIYPEGKDAAKTYVRKDRDGDMLLADNAHVKAVVIDQGMEEFEGYTVTLYLENKTDLPVVFSVDDAEVNGYVTDPMWAAVLPAGCSGFEKVVWETEELEGNGITDVKTIQFNLTAFSYEDSLDGTCFLDDSVSLEN